MNKNKDKLVQIRLLWGTWYKNTEICIKIWGTFFTRQIDVIHMEIHEDTQICICMQSCVCVCVCVCEREREEKWGQ